MVMVLFAAMVLIPAGYAAAERSCQTQTGESVFTVYPKAHGTKILGTLALYYEVVGYGEPDYGDRCQIFTNMYAFLRIRDKKDLYGFSMKPGPEEEPLCYFLETTLQEERVLTFFSESVMPIMFPDIPADAFSLKHIEEIKDGGGESDLEPLFTIMDITVAVRE